MSNIKSLFQKRLEMGIDSENKWDGRGRGITLPFCFFRQALTKLTEFSLGASSFILWLRFALISWTCWILVRLNSVYVNFQDFWNKFSFIFGQLCCLEKSLCGLEVGWAEVIRQTTPSAGCNISHNADCRSNYLLNIPCPFLDIICFKQSGRCNWFLSKRPQSLLVEFQVFV